MLPALKLKFCERVLIHDIPQTLELTSQSLASTHYTRRYTLLEYTTRCLHGRYTLHYTQHNFTTLSLHAVTTLGRFYLHALTTRAGPALTTRWSSALHDEAV